MDPTGTNAPAWRLLDAVEAAATLGVSLRSFRRHVVPALPSLRMGRSVRYDPRDLEAWVAAHKGGHERQPVASPPRARAGKGSAPVVIDELTQRRARDALGRLGLIDTSRGARPRRSS